MTRARRVHPAVRRKFAKDSPGASPAWNRIWRVGREVRSQQEGYVLTIFSFDSAVSPAKGGWLCGANESRKAREQAVGIGGITAVRWGAAMGRSRGCRGIV